MNSRDLLAGEQAHVLFLSFLWKWGMGKNAKIPTAKEIAKQYADMRRGGYSTGRLFIGENQLKEDGLAYYVEVGDE